MDRDDSRSGGQDLPLLTASGELLAAHRSAFRQERVFGRALLLVVGRVLAFGRKTLTQLLVALGRGAADWSGWYRLLSVPRVGYAKLCGCLVGETCQEVAPEEADVVVTDGVGFGRSSRTMPGTQWGRGLKTAKWRPGIERQQRFVNLSWLTPQENGYSRAVPLRLQWWGSEKAQVPAGEAPRTEWAGGLELVQWVRHELNGAGRKEQEILWLGDGSYDVTALWKQVPAGVVLLTKANCQRALYRLPGPGAHKNRKYGERAPTPQAWLGERAGWTRTVLRVRGKDLPLTWRVEGPFLLQGAAGQPVFLIVVKGRQVKRAGGTHYIKPVFLLVSARRQGDQWVLPWTAELLLSWALQRWEVEVCHREMKSGLGVGEMQCWSQTSAILSVQWGAWVYAVLVLAGYRAWGGLTPSPVRPPGAWWPGSGRWSLNTLWRGYRQELWGEMHFRPLSWWTPSNLPGNDEALSGLWNAVWGSLRC